MDFFQLSGDPVTIAIVVVIIILIFVWYFMNKKNDSFSSNDLIGLSKQPKTFNEQRYYSPDTMDRFSVASGQVEPQ